MTNTDVPDSVRVALKVLRERADGVADQRAKRTVSLAADLLERMANDLQCLPVWRALEARSDPMAETTANKALALGKAGAFSSAATLELLEDSERFRRLMGAYRPAENVESLAIAVAEAHQQVVEQHTRGSKRAAYAKVNALVGKLSRALDDLPSDATFGPYQFQLIRVAWSGDQFWESTPIEPIADDSTVDDLLVISGRSRYYREFLAGLLLDVERWSKRDPQVSKPEHDGAYRQAFVRSLKRHFAARYGQELNAVVVAVTRSVLGDEAESLTESLVARL